jgi:hypothetical protein
MVVSLLEVHHESLYRSEKSPSNVTGRKKLKTGTCCQWKDFHELQHHYFSDLKRQTHEIFIVEKTVAFLAMLSPRHFRFP